MLSTDYPHGAGTGPQSMAAAERVVYHIIESGMDAIGDNHTSIDRMLRFVSDDERNKLKQTLEKKEFTVRHGVPRGSADIPCAAILVTDEREEQKYFGDHMEMGDDSFDESSAFLGQSTKREIFGSLNRMSMTIFLYDQNPTILQHYYSICWSILRGSRDIFNKLGLEFVEISGGDVAPDPTLAPNLVYIRRITLVVRGLRTYSLPTEIIDRILLSVQLV